MDLGADVYELYSRTPIKPLQNSTEKNLNPNISEQNVPKIAKNNIMQNRVSRHILNPPVQPKRPVQPKPVEVQPTPTEPQPAVQPKSVEVPPKADNPVKPKSKTEVK